MPGYFLDASALAKLYHPEVASEPMESLVQAPGMRLITSQLSLIEIQSVFATRIRTGVIDKATLDQLGGLFFSDLAKGRFEVALLGPPPLSERLRRSFEHTRWTMHSETLDAMKRCGAASDLVASDKTCSKWRLLAI